MAVFRGRYAPSPTGRLHLGNLQTALLSWLHCRLRQGHFILRIDDLDTPRNKPGALEQMLADLRLLGIDWDDVEIQSNRITIYQHYFNQLIKMRRVFACCCSRKDVAEAMSAPHAATDGATDTGLIYPGTCRNKNLLQQQQTDIACRFIVNSERICFHDELCGVQTQNLQQRIGDFVIKRRDALFAYQFASAVDDMHMGITEVVRGHDLLDSSFRQIALIQAFNETAPKFCHVPLVLDEHGNRLSKRDGSASLKQRQDNSIEQIIADIINPLGLLNQRVDKISSYELLQELNFASFIEALKNHTA